MARPLHVCSLYLPVLKSRRFNVALTPVEHEHGWDVLIFPDYRRKALAVSCTHGQNIRLRNASNHGHAGRRALSIRSPSVRKTGACQQVPNPLNQTWASHGIPLIIEETNMIDALDFGQRPIKRLLCCCRKSSKVQQDYSLVSAK